MKYCESKEETKENEEFDNIQKKQKQKLIYIWDKRKRKEREYWKIFWNRMEKCFGDDYFDKGQKYIWRKAKKDEMFEIFHIEYRLDISNISNEAWKKVEAKNFTKYRLLHPPKETETIYRGFIRL
jgi:hypothetical protein